MASRFRAAKWPPRGEEAEALPRRLLSDGATGVVVKAQIHAGGRGKGGGVKIAKSWKKPAKSPAKMLGMHLVTHQTGPEGRKVQRLLIEETLPIAASFISASCSIALTASRFHGVCSGRHGHRRGRGAKSRKPSCKEFIEPGVGLQPFQARKLAFGTRH